MKTWVQRTVIVALWIGAIAAWRSFQRSEDLSTIEAAQRMVDSIDGAWWGIFAFGFAYLLRPILLFPASLATVAAGLLFGPVVGVLVVIVAANASAMLAYVMGRLLAGESVDANGDEERASLLARWGDKMRTNSFESVFVMRLLFLPYDLVNYASGALRIRWTSFLLATALGTLPGTIAFVLLGASIVRLDQGLGGINPLTVVVSVAIFAASIVIARTARARTLEAPSDASMSIDRPGAGIGA